MLSARSARRKEVAVPLSPADLTPSDWLMQVLVFVIVSYPIGGGCAFIVSSGIYHLFLERGDRPRYLEHGEPFVTVLVPAHNEEKSIQSTVHWLENQLNY